MDQFLTLPVFLCAMGLLSETLCSLTLEAEAGDNVTIWCRHDLTVTDYIYWFKHTSDSVPLLLGCKKFRASAPSQPCYFFTESERIVMSVHGRNTSLTITAVKVSDTGLYYCSFSDTLIFSNSTSLLVKGVNKTFYENLEKATGSNSSAVFFMLTVVFGALIVILLGVLIFIILKNTDRKTQRGAEAEDNEDPDSDSVHHAAQRSSDQKTKRTKRRHEKVFTHVVYSSVGQSDVSPPNKSLFQKHSPSPEVVCHATGFFPKAVVISWRKDGEEVQEDVELGETLPNQDGSFQKRSILRVPAEELQEHTYTCVIQHSSLEKELVIEVPKGPVNLQIYSESEK